YCINSASLRFIPAAELTRAGYAEYAKLFPEVKQMPMNAEATSDGELPAEARAAAVKNRTNVAPALEVAVLGGRCFWGMAELLRKLPGVSDTDVGYTGGAGGDASYPVVCSGSTGHAESVRIVFDPTKLPYEKLIEFFFKIHDPTTLNRQHNDVGTQY